MSIIGKYIPNAENEDTTTRGAYSKYIPSTGIVDIAPAPVRRISIVPEPAPIIKQPVIEDASILPLFTGKYKRMGDVALSFTQGIFSVPEAITGIADIFTGGKVGKFVEKAEKKILGSTTRETREVLERMKTSEQQLATQQVAEAKGFLPTAKSMIKRPSTIVGGIAESIPSIIAGGGVARTTISVMKAVGLKISPIIAGALGEGAISGGTLAEQTRQMQPKGELTGKQATIAGVSGVLTGVLGTFGGKIAAKLGIADVDTLLAGGATDQVRRSILMQAAKGALSESVFEELPQSIQEQIASNINNKKPWKEGVAEAGAQGAMTAIFMGGAVSGGAQGVTNKTIKDFEKIKNQIIEDNKDHPMVKEYVKNEKTFTEVMNYIDKTSEVETPDQVLQKLQEAGLDEATATIMISEAENRKIASKFTLEPQPVEVLGVEPQEIIAEKPAIPKLTEIEIQTERKSLHENIRESYKSVGRVEGMPEFFKADEELSNIWQEMELAKAGERLFTEEGVRGIPSTFPQWIDEENRSKALFEKVITKLDLNKLEYPTGKMSTKQRSLYNNILDQLDVRLGVDTSIIRNKILQSYEQGDKRETAKKSKRGVDRGTIRAGTGKLKGATIEEVVTTKARTSKGEVGQASIGRYRDDTEAIINASALKPIQFPELIDISRELMGNTPFIKKYTKANGMFYGRGGGEIGLHPDLFKKENLGQLQKTLAHEIGHLIDYLPNQTMTRGNLAGRLNTLRDFRKDFFAPMGASRTDAELREQMWALSKYWRPVDEATASASHLAYRKGSDEIYADFISALFNDPRLTADMAPTAYNVFFEKLDAKPKVKEAYFGLQELLRYGDVIAKRRSATQKMFKTTEQNARERQIQDQVEKEANERSIWFKFKTQAVDITEAVREKVNEAKKRGVRINDDDNPNYYLEQRNYLGGKIKAEVDEKFNGIYQELQKNELAWEDLGELMFYERVLKGDRQDIANPLGYQPDFVRELYDVYEDVGTVKPDQVQYEKGTGDMRATLGDEKFNILKSLAEKYRANLKGFFKQGREEGIYNIELEKMFENNAFYVPFKGAKYSGVTKTAFTVKHQKGTLGDIENPANTGIEKAVSIIRAMERNKVARKTMDFLQANFADEVQEAKLDKNGYPIDPRETDLGLVTYMKDGKVKGFYVDKYIAESIQKKTVSDMNVGIEVLKYFNSGLFRPLFITFNLGFQSFNLIRDFKRFWKNVPNMTILKAMKLYAKSARGAKIRAFGLPKNPSPADIEAYNLINRLEKEQVLSITFNDVIKGEAIEDKQIERILREVGIREAEKTKIGTLAEKIGVNAKTPIIRELRGVLKTIEKLGNMIETLPKVAGLYAMEGTMPPMEMRSYLRKYVGSPDFLAGGKFKPYMNEVFLFSNAIFHGIRSDYEIATAPKSRGAYWMKTAQAELVPKILMMMAVAGLFGDDFEEMFANVSEYDKTNYAIIPLGIDQNGKTVYVRIPSDETGRLIGGLFWKTMNAVKEPEKLAQMETYTNILAYAGGQVPSLTPVVTAGMNATQFLAGNNPYDFFRGRPVLTDQQQQAGGTERLKPFLSYMFEQLGGGVFLKLYTNETVPRNLSLSEKIVALPVLSNIAGRFVRVSDYGQKEILRNISNEVKTEQASESLQNRRIVFDYVDNARGKSPAEANMMKHQMINEIFNGVPKTQQDRTKAQSLAKRFDTLLLRGSADARIDSLITAQSNDEKIALLKQYKKTMSVTDFEDLKKFVIQKRVVSPQVFQMFVRGMDKQND